MDWRVKTAKIVAENCVMRQQELRANWFIKRS